MIAERRQILFSPEALLDAVRLYGALPQQQDLPFGLVVSLTVKMAGTSPAMDVHVQQSGASQLRTVPLSGTKILAALILLCRNRHIPVPKQAKKSLAVEGQGLLLTLFCTNFRKISQSEANAA